MKYGLWFLIISFSISVTPISGMCETRVTVPTASGKSGSGIALPVPAGSEGEKVAAQMSKDATATTQLVEKPSNAVGSEYVIGAEDVLEITVWRNPDLSRQVQVRPDGRFSMPIIRDVVAVGKTPTLLAEELTNRLKEYVQNPVVAVSVKDVQSSNIFLLGEVAHPGKYPLKSKTTLLQGITIAGGFKDTAARNQIVIFRFTETAPGMKRFTASYDDIVLRSGMNDNFELKPGDTLVVPSESMVVFPGR